MTSNLTPKPRRYRSFSKESRFPLNVPVDRNSHNVSANLSIMSEKVPKTFTPNGLSFHSLKSQNIQNESKISLYSEIERLSVLNYELKMQTDNLINQMSIHNHLIRKVPDLEEVILNLREELANKDDLLSRKDEIMHHRAQEFEAMHRDLLAIKNTELINRDLSLQIEHLTNDNQKITHILRNRNHDIEIMKHDIAKLQGAQFTISDLNRRIDTLSNELIEKVHELDECSLLNQELQNFKVKCVEMQIDYAQEKIHLKELYEISKERELNDLNYKFNEEKSILELKLKSADNTGIVLDSENDRLREKLKESDVQVASLEEQKRNLERHFDDFEKLKALLSDATYEIESLRDQMSHQEIRHNINLEEHQKMSGNSFETKKKELETHLKTLYEYQLKDAQDKWNQEKADLENLLHRYTKENEDINTINQQKTAEIEMIRKEMSFQEVIRQRSLDLENKIMVLLGENDSISNLNEERLKEIEELKIKISQIEQNHDLHINELSRKHEEVKKSTVHKEVKDMNDKHGTEISALESKIFQLKQTISTNENKFDYLEGEADRLKSLINFKQVELDDQKKFYQNLELNMAHDLDYLRQQFETYKKANIDIVSLQIKFEAERTTYQTQIIQLKEKIAQLESRIEILKNENERGNILYTERIIEIDNLKKKFKELEENTSHQNSDLRAELDYLKNNSFDAKEIAIRNSAEKAGYENQIRQLKTMSDNGKQELENLYDLMNQRKKEYEGYIKQNEELRKQVDKLTKQINFVDSEFSSKSFKYDGMNLTIQELERDKFVLQQQLEKKSSEVSKKNKELSNKIEEIDSLKNKYESAIENYNKLSPQLMGKLMRD